MASTASEFTSRYLTHRDVREANPDWTDGMVDDYLALKRDVITFADSFDGDLESLLIRVAILELKVLALEIRIALLEDRVTYLEGTLVVTAVDHTTIGNQTVICTDALTVILTASPNDKDIVIVKVSNGNVTIDGNGRTIDGDLSILLRRNFIGLQMQYSAVLDAWFEI